MRARLKPLDRQTIVITGGSSGIGLATARRAVSQGAQVVLAARNREALQAVCSELQSKGGRATFAVADVGDAAAVDHIVETAVQAFGGFDTWVNDAGVGVYGQLMDIPLEEHERLFRTNYWGVVNGSRAAVRHLEGRPGGGALINLGSVTSDFAVPILGAYAASKHAVKGFTDALRLELKHAGVPVSVTLIKPSGIGTPFPVHARNHMDTDPQVVPPLYAPEIVADAILHAAVHPVRSLTIGSAGGLMAGVAVAAPALTDPLFAWAMPWLQRSSRPATAADNLFAASKDGGVHHPVTGPGRPFSIYTRLSKHPGAALGVGLAALGSVALICTRGRRGGRR